MNKERMMLLADLLDSISPEKFSLTYWASYNSYDEEDDSFSYISQDGDYVDLSVYKCNTAGCVAGWAVALKNDLSVDNLVHVGEVERQAREYLELTHDQAHSLFYYSSVSIWNDYHEELGLNDEFGYDHAVKSHHAATMVRNLAEGKWVFS